MAEHSRYNVSGKGAGINNGILNNKLGIKDQKVLDDAETVLLSDTYAHFFNLMEKQKLEFDLDLIFEIHKYFLDTLYSWAGKVRTINISKGDMLFAPVKCIDKSLKLFQEILTKKLPQKKASKK